MIVVDTHVVIWNALQPNRLSANAVTALAAANEEDGIIICDISLWEIAMLMAAGRLRIASPCATFLDHVLKSNAYHLLPISPKVAELSARLFGETHKDPADRIIAATAIVSKVPLVTADAFLRKAKQVRTIW